MCLTRVITEKDPTTKWQTAWKAYEIEDGRLVNPFAKHKSAPGPGKMQVAERGRSKILAEDETPYTQGYHSYKNKKPAESVVRTLCGSQGLKAVLVKVLVKGIHTIGDGWPITYHRKCREHSLVLVSSHIRISKKEYERCTSLS